jgi:osmotically-inducible protein OsmY
MSKATRKRAERTLTDVVRTLDQVRATLARRLDEVDLEATGKRSVRWAGKVRNDIERRARPKRRRIPPAGIAGIAGVVLLGAAAGVGYLLYDRERREAARRRFDGVQRGARERYAELTGRAQDLMDLEKKVRAAIANGGRLLQGLEVVVEGRTVYLRGAVNDPGAVDAAAERAHAIPGVVAVVNLTTSAGTANNAKSSRPRASGSGTRSS